MIVLDAHMWVWFNTGDRALSRQVAAAIESGGSSTVLPSVCIWEVLMLLQRGRLESNQPPEPTIRAWLTTGPMTIAPLTADIAILARTLAFKHDDPADRFIAATAYHLGLPLATTDARLRSLPWLKTIS